MSEINSLLKAVDFFGQGLIIVQGKLKINGKEPLTSHQ